MTCVAQLVAVVTSAAVVAAAAAAAAAVAAAAAAVDAPRHQALLTSLQPCIGS